MTAVVGHAGAVGTGPWTGFTPDNLHFSDTLAASAFLDSLAEYAQSASSFGFAIPADATITSLTVRGEYYFRGEAGVETSSERFLTLVPSYGGVYYGAQAHVDLAANEDASEWTTVEGVAHDNLPTVAQLNSPDFTVVASAHQHASWNTWVCLNYIQLIVEYDEYVPPEPPEPGVPTVTTTAVTSITPNWASSGGTVTAENGSAVSGRGIVWGASGVTLENYDGMGDSSSGGMGGYTCVAAPLEQGKGYVVRAYAVNSSGVGYGAELYFETPDGRPTVVTTAVTSITGYWASSGGTVVSEGWAAVSQRGIVWGASGVTRENYDGISDSSSGGIGGYTSVASPLLVSKGYVLRAYAINSYGVAYGAEVYFETLYAPTVVTTPITAITPFTATGGGTVTSEGGGAVSERGICWGTSPNPRTKVGSGSGGIGAFTNYLTGLAPGTRYFVAAWATNNIPTRTDAYGADVTFVTHALPTIATASVYDIEATTATSGGDVASDGGEAVTARGVCWSIAENPTTAASKTIDGSGVGTFVSHLTGLTEGATYNVRAYAVNAAGTAYGAAVVFTATASAPPVEPPPGPPRDPSENLLFDGTLELKVGTLDVAGSATQVKYSNSNPGGFGNLSFRLPADAPYAAFDAQVVKGAAVTMKHGLVGFVATLFEGEVTSDVSHATIAGGKAYYDVTCAGLWWAAGQRKDFSMVIGDDDYGQWYAMDDNAKAFQVSTDGCLEIRLEAGQSAAAGDSASLYYWLGKGMGDPAASIDFLFGLLGLNVPGGEADWSAHVSFAPTPWGPWTERIQWWGGPATDLALCIPALGDNPQALRLQLSTGSAVDALAADCFVRLDKMSVGSGISANGLSAVTAANVIPVMTSATAPSGTASASSNYEAARAEWKAFDHVNPPGASEGWLAAVGTTGWLQYRFPAAQVITQYAVTSRNEAANVRAPKSWTFKASNDGTTWVTLDTQTNVTDWATTPNLRKVFDIANTTAYAYYRLNITASNATYVGVGELEMMVVDTAAVGVVTATSAHGLKTGDRVFITQSAVSTPTVSGWRTVTVINATHFTVPVNVTSAGGAGTFYKATRIDQALVEIAVTTGLASLASLQPGGIGNLNWGLVVRPHASRAGGIDLLAATNVAPFDYGFWDNRTFHCKDRPLTIRALHDYLIDSSLPGIDFDVRRATEDSPTVVKVLYKFRDVDGGTSSYPDGTALAVYRPSAPTWGDASVVLDVWNEWADLSLTTAQAGDLGDQILAWLSANAYQGGGSIAPATVPLRDAGYTDNIIPAMTSATAPSGVVTESGHSASYAAWMAFDHTNPAAGVGTWMTNAVTGYIGYQFPAARTVTRYAVTSRNEAANVRAPKSWTFKASNDGTTWVTLDTQTNVTSWAATPNVRKVFDIANSTAYAYYRLDITASNDANYVGLGELEMMKAVLTAGCSVPAAYIRAGDYIEDSNLDTGPLMITGFSMDADRGVATIGIGENRRAFVERLTPDTA